MGKWFERNIRIDGTNHTGLAVLTLRAVEPNRRRVLDANRVGQELVRCDCGSIGGHEAGEESIGLVRHYVLNGNAGVVECGLHDGVILSCLLVVSLV